VSGGDLDADAVIVGSGPGGATAADVLTAAGWSVIVLEKGRNHLLDLEPPYGFKGDFSNDEIKFGRRHFLGPDPLLEPRAFRRAEADGDHLLLGDVNNLPSGVGGGAVHADAKMPRFREVDFRLLSERGPIDGADVADWPLDYAELEPCYAEAERLVGVAGEAGSNPFESWRSGPYPMGPGPDMYGAILSSEAASRLGYHPYRAPTGANSTDYDGRPACNNCGFCGQYGCPIHAKGDAVSSLRRALGSGRCEIRPRAMVTEVALDGSGRRARAVRYLDASGDGQEVTAAHVVLAGGAFETPRLLLRGGIANSSGLVGKLLMFHFQTYVAASFPFSLHPNRGRTVTHHHDDFVAPNADDLAAARRAGLPWFTGGTVEHGGGTGPITEALNCPPGSLHKELMRSSMLRDRLWVFTMQGEDMPQAVNRVDLHPSVRDVHGLPAGRVTYSPHPHELAASAHWGPKLEAIHTEAGASWTARTTSPPTDQDSAAAMGWAPISRHVMGTCRMGTDPRRSVVDPYGRFHDVENMICTDSSVFVTSSGYNPTLTIVALAIRASRALADAGPSTRGADRAGARR
jgi:gluconate 2-dehydrogenase alpha chain